MNKRGEATRLRVLEAGVRIIARDGLYGLNSGSICDEAKLDVATIFYHYTSLLILRRAVADRAIETDDVQAIAHLIVARFPPTNEWSSTRRLSYLRRAEMA